MNINKEKLYVIISAEDLAATIQANMIQVVKDHIQPHDARRARRIINNINDTSPEKNYRRRPQQIKEVRVRQEYKNDPDYSDIKQYLFVKK